MDPRPLWCCGSPKSLTRLRRNGRPWRRSFCSRRYYGQVDEIIRTVSTFSFGAFAAEAVDSGFGGAMPPLGPLYRQRVFVDDTLAEEPEIVFDAGTHTDAIRMRYADFAAVAKPVVGSFGKRPSS
jgi:hypothetical protein